jgi:hypothetical protein
LKKKGKIMKKLLLQACLLAATISPVCAMVDNTVQAAADLATDTVRDTANVARAAVGLPVVEDGGYRHGSRWSHHDYGTTYPHRGLRARYRDHRYAMNQHRVEEDKEKLAQDKAELARTR